MPTTTPTYEKVKLLASQLRTEKTIRKRRDIGEKLNQFLADDGQRRKLAMEATPRRTGGSDDFSHSSAAQRRTKLSQLWTLIIMGAISVTQSTGTGKGRAKRTLDDIELPFKLLQTCTRPDDFELDGLDIPKVTKKTLRALINYCINLLSENTEDEAGSDEVEMKMLEMMEFICSNPDFVANFKKSTLSNDFRNVMSELSERLTPEFEEENEDAFALAAKTISSLFHSCTLIGVQMHEFVPDTIRIISNWCRYHVHKNKIQPSSNALPHLFNLASSILDNYPDVSMGPMKSSNVGRALLSYCKKCYNGYNDKSISVQNQQALNNYLLSHLILAQYAGKLEGRAPGDLGDLKKASMTNKQLVETLDLVTSAIHKLISEIDGNTGVRHKKSSHWRYYVWQPSNVRHHKALQLGARLMACTQRLFFSSAGWAMINEEENLDDNLLDRLKVIDNTNDGEWINPDYRKDEVVSVEVLKDCPWMKFVAKELLAGIKGEEFAALQASLFSGPHSEDVQLTFKPLFEDLEAMLPTATPSPLFALAMITSCAEIFPGGECWSSSTFGNWRRLSFIDTNHYASSYYNCCTPDNLAFLLLLLSVCLEYHGGPQGDIHLQCSLLHAIQRLAETSLILYNNFQEDAQQVQGLEYAWRRIWTILFLPDLRYQAATEVTTRGSLGDLVMTLLRDIIGKRCTEASLFSRRTCLNKQASFIYENQFQLWSLPVFKRPRDTGSESVYAVISKVLSEAGLSSSGIDCIGSKSTSLAGESEPTSRRYRLIQFVLGCLEQTITSGAKHEDADSSVEYRTAIATACVLSLVSGKGPDHYINLDDNDNADGKDDLWFRNILFSTFEGTEPELLFNFTPLDIMQNSIRSEGGEDSKLLIKRSQMEFREKVIDSLWGSIRNSHNSQSCFEPPGPRHDSLPMLSSHVRKEHTLRQACASIYADFVSDTEAAGLKDNALSFFQERLFSLRDECEQNNETSTPADNENSFALNVISESLTCSILSAKVDLSVRLWCTKTPLRDDLKEILLRTSSFVERSSSSLRQDQDFAYAAKGFVQICRALADVSCTFRIALPSGNLNNTAKFCRSALEAYAMRNRKSIDFAARKPGTPGIKSRQTDDDDFMDEDDEGIHVTLPRSNPPCRDSSSDDDSIYEKGKKKKRKRRSHPDDAAINKRGRHGDDVAAGLDLESAQIIALLLLILDPSPSTGQFTCESLLGTELDLDPDSIKGDMDLRLCGLCANILNQVNPLLNSDNFDPDESFDSQGRFTVVEMLCCIVDLVRACAGPSSPARLVGNSEVVPLLQWGRKLNYGYNLSEREVRRIVEILICTEGMEIRPTLRANRIRACTMAFQAGNDLFHRHFDKHFASIVKGSLQDKCFHVRYSGYEAVGAAVASLDEEKIVSAVEAILPPVSSAPTNGHQDSRFKQWFQESVFCSIEDEGASKEFNVEDAKFVLEAESMFCRSIMAGCSQSPSLFAKQLFAIIMFASGRPDLEILCYQALEKTATLRGYSSTEDMIDHEGEAMAKLWIENAGHDLPLVLTAPEIVRAIIYRGPGGTSDILPSHYPKIAKEASGLFVERYCQTLVPLALFRSIASAPENLKIGEDHEQDLRLLESDSKFQAICSMRFPEAIFDKSLPMLLKRHLPDIQGFCLPILKWEKARGRHRSTCNKVVDIMNSILSPKTMESRLSKRADSIARSIFDMIDKSDLLSGLLPDCDEPYFEALLSLIQKLPPEKEFECGDVLLRVGTSATEVLLRGFARLSFSNVPRKQIKQNWFTIRLQCYILSCQIRKRDHENLQLGFCIHVLTEALLKTNSSPVRSLIFPILVNILKDALSYLDLEDLRREINPVVQRLIGACFYIHEASQNSFLRICRRRYNEFQMTTWRCFGLARGQPSTHEVGAWGWEADESFERNSSKEAVDKYGASVGNGIRNGITHTYEILAWIFDNSIALEIETIVLACAGAPYSLLESEQDLLKSYDVHFSAQNLALEFVQKLGQNFDDIQTDIGFLVKGLIELLNDRQAWMNKVASSFGADERSLKVGSSPNTLNTDQRLLHSALCQLERALHKQQSFESETSPIPKADLERLVRALSYVCGAFCPLELKVAATRCLGEIKTAVVEELSSIHASKVEYKWLERAGAKNEVLSTMQARCLECLAKSLKSPEARVALTASKTIQAILSSNIDTRRWDILEDTKRGGVLEPFMKQSKDFKQKIDPLTQYELESLQDKCGLEGDEFEESNSWCWNTKLWQRLTSKHTFEGWVRNVTTALVVCCCSNPPSDRRGDSSSKISSKQRQERSEHHLFLSLCHRMCFLEQDFCVSVFPYLVLVLLDDLNVSSDSEVLQRLSTAFTTLISCPETSAGDINRLNETRINTKAQSLVLDTLDLLRRISQHRFLSSRDHKKNPKPRNYDSNAGKFIKNMKDYDYLPAPPAWSGVAYSITVRLDGLLVARACIQARRFALALFFLELYLDNKLGKSAGIFGLLSDQAMGKKNAINSFLPTSSSRTEDDSDRMRDVTGSGNEHSRMLMPVLEILSECFEGLHESENLDVTKAQQASLEFFDGDVYSNKFDGQAYGRDSRDILRQLNSDDMNDEMTHLRALHAMEDLGIHRVSQAFLDCVSSNHSLTMSSATTSKLREAWFRSYLSTARWENIDDIENQQQSKIFKSDGTRSVAIDMATAEPGFFEAMSKAFRSFCFDDMVSCRSFLLQARLSNLDSVSLTGESESPLAGIVEHIEKLKAVSDLERLTKGLVKMSDLHLILGTDEAGSRNEGMDYYPRMTEFASMACGGSHLHTHMQGFAFKMPELIIRALLAKKLPNLNQNELSDLLVSHLRKSAFQARHLRRLGLAQETMHRLRLFLQSLTEHRQPEESSVSIQILDICMEEARILECRGDIKSAIRKLDQIINLLQQKEERGGQLDSKLDGMLADAQILCGKWMAEYKMREATEVLTTYQEPGADRALRLSFAHECRENAKRATKGILEVGNMASNLYETLISRTQSREYKQTSSSILEQERDDERCREIVQKCESMKRKQEGGNELEEKVQETRIKRIQSYQSNLKKDIRIKKVQQENLLASVAHYWKLAIDSVGKALSIAGTDQDDDLSRHVFRMTSLWFSQSSGTDAASNDIMAPWIDQIPSFRFIPLTYQLFARIESSSPGDDTGFQRTLRLLVLKMSTEHPYHTIVPLIALSKGVNQRNADVGESKARAASNLLSELKNDGSGFVCSLVSSYSVLIEYYNALAFAPTNMFASPKKNRKKIRFSSFFSAVKLNAHVRNSFHTYKPGSTPPCVFTTPPPIQADANYGAGIDDPVGAERVARFEKEFDITDEGIHRPKIIICIGSRGTRFRQLVKGMDDLRQDSIMSQVIGFVNSVFARQNTAVVVDSRQDTSLRKSREHLRMATYNVIPLGPESGVVEWVENSIPMRDYISDKRDSAGAHSRYYPGEWSLDYCRTHMENSPISRRRKSFDEVCLRYSPVYRFFFVEKFGHCMQKWHAAKMKFTRSVAVSSIVGWLNGIGDRHLSNILIREKTGEVVHIDFGYVFEQAKLLPTPETVPFRLTRNMTDGMGPCGTEGAFVSAAEETMRLLRSNKLGLMTILSAVLSDPLYKWTMDPVEAKRRQQSDNEGQDLNGIIGEGPTRSMDAETDDEKNKSGAAAIAKIQEKLQGYEDSTSGQQQGVESQVTFLLNAARDPENLCRLFAGWMAWV